MRGGAELSTIAEMHPRAREREGGERVSARRLTAGLAATTARCSAGSGRLWSRRIVGGDPRPKVEDDGLSKVATRLASRGLVERKRESRRSL